MKYGVKIYGTALGYTTSHDDKWLSYYDLEVDNGIGLIKTSSNPEDALTFNSAKNAMDFCMQVPKCNPIRKDFDNKPNRPITAYNISIEPIPLSN